MSKKQKIALFISLLALTGLTGYIFGAFNVVSDTAILGGGNLPDRCEVFDQVSSRSIKDTVKASAGTVYSLTVSYTGTQIRYFQLHDQATAPKTSSTPELSIPIAGTTSSNSPTLFDYKPNVPMNFENGISFAMSSAFATFSSLSPAFDNTRLFVTVCYK